MTVTMTAKNQITIPKKITNALGLGRGAMFEIGVFKSGIELYSFRNKGERNSLIQNTRIETLGAQEEEKRNAQPKDLSVI